jgi:hypothetical protein
MTSIARAAAAASPSGRAAGDGVGRGEVLVESVALVDVVAVECVDRA